MPLRIHSATNTSTTLNKNGRRQPQLRNCSLVVLALISETKAGGKQQTHAVTHLNSAAVEGFLFLGALSTASSAAPPHSPPTAKP